jgi:prephenate dehydrogenase
MPGHALIVGLGLIGGSVALALRERGWTVRYLDPRVETGRFERVEAIDAESLVILATPVDAAVSILRELPTRSGAVTSVCSVMQPLRAAAGGRFIAGHPLAGSHESGFAAARADLFAGKRWFADRDDPNVAEVVRDCGAVMEVVEAEEHDRAVALTSHLPQVLSTALAAHLASHEELLRFGGSGLETFLRLAGSDADVWKPVLEANRAHIAAHADEVQRIVREMLSSDPERFFADAQRLWRKLSL